MLCSLQLNGLVEALRKMPWDLGRQFQVVTVIIDPRESPRRAQDTKDKYVKYYDRAGTAAGWHFLTGEDEDIKAVAATVGFGYRYSSRQEAVRPSGRLDPLHARRPRVALHRRGEVRSADAAAGPGRGIGGQSRHDLRPGAPLLLPLRCGRAAATGRPPSISCRLPPG